MVLHSRSRLLFAFLILSTTVATAQAQKRIGLSSTEPTSGRFVETDEGFMIAYSSMIPGTNVSFEMMPVPGGSFSMKHRQSEDVTEAVDVTIEPFWIGRYEVTWAEYSQFYELQKSFRRFEHLGIREVTEANQVDAVTAPSMLYDALSYFPAANEREWPQHPAVAMTQYAAKQYTKWLSRLSGEFYRLPSEAEWEYASRAGSSASFCFGDDNRTLPDYAWFLDNAGEDTHPVGLKKPSRWGLYDMHGNASEWVLDQYSETLDALAKTVAEGEQPIHWPTRLHPRVVCGGSWDSAPEDCRSSARLGSSVDWHEDEPLIPPSPTWLASSVQRQIGFRIIRPLMPPQGNEQGKYWNADVAELKQAIAEYSANARSFIGVVDTTLPTAIKRLAH